MPKTSKNKKPVAPGYVQHRLPLDIHDALKDRSIKQGQTQGNILRELLGLPLRTKNGVQEVSPIEP